LGRLRQVTVRFRKIERPAGGSRKTVTLAFDFLQAAEKLSTRVILSAAKDLALRIFLKMHRARFFASLRMTVSNSFSAAC
jgi:hypothetical protein